MIKRKAKFYNNCIYHIFNKSIANFNIFTSGSNCERFIQTIAFYNNPENKISYSKYLRDYKNKGDSLNIFENNNQYVKVICYCLMPDHYHFLIRVNHYKNIYRFIDTIETSYTRYFNLKYKRKGPLWQSSYRSIKIKNNEQLLHVSRYIHLNPTTAKLVDKPERWEYSSYKLFINNDDFLQSIKEISINDKTIYKKFVEDNIDYQIKLKIIKKFLID